jgi:uncharacterized membrane protein
MQGKLLEISDQFGNPCTMDARMLSFSSQKFACAWVVSGGCVSLLFIVPQ